MRAISGKELARLLERKGWLLMRVQGSHHIFGIPGSTVRLSVPVHRNQTLKVGLLHNLMKRRVFAKKIFNDEYECHKEPQKAQT